MPSPATGHDIVILKLNSAGAYQWHTFYGTDTAGASAIAVDSSANVYVAGYSPATWNGPTGQAPLHAYTNGDDIAVVKLNSAGAYQWHTFYGGTGDDGTDGIALDSSANVYVTGYSAATWNGPTGQAPLNAFTGTGSDIVILKLNSAGAYQWHTFYGTGTAGASAIAVDSSANVYVAGYGDATWNGPTGQAPLHAYTNSYDIAVVKLNSAGAYQWHTFYGGTGDDGADGIALDSRANIYVTGYSFATWNGPTGQAPLNAFSGGIDDIVILNLNSAGAYQWHAFYGGTGNNEAHGIALDSSANVYVAGYSDATWNGPTGQAPLHAYTNGDDIAVVKLGPTPAKVRVETASDGSGTVVPAQTVNIGNSITVYAITRDASNAFIANVAADTWSLQSITGGVVNGDLVPNGDSKSAVFTGHVAGTAQISATLGTLTPTNSGTLTVAAIPALTVTMVNPNTGNQGQCPMTVVITGTNLTGATAVSFGAGITVSSFVVNCATQITATICINANTTPGAYNISLTSPGGTATLTGGFTVVQQNQLIGTGATTSHGSSFSGTTTTTQPVGLPNIVTQSAILSAKSVTPGTPITVTADIANKGTANGSNAVTLYVNGQVETTQGVIVNSGGSTKLTFNVSRSEPGEYNVYVDGTPAGSFKVEMVTANDSILIFSVALIAVAFLVGMFLLWRRQRTGSH